MREWRELRLYFKAMADVRRLRMVAEIASTPDIAVKDLCVRLRASQPLVSWHLRVLVRCGLVKTRRSGRQVLCQLNQTAFSAYQARLSQLLTDSDHDDAIDSTRDSRDDAVRLLPKSAGQSLTPQA